MTCPGCQQENPPEAQFCLEACGTPAPPEDPTDRAPMPAPPAVAAFHGRPMTKQTGHDWPHPIQIIASPPSREYALSL